MASRDLAEYLKSTARDPWVWGQNDCCQWASTWVQSVTGHDPAGPLRGAYKTAKGAHNRIRQAHGLVTLAGDLMAACGFEKTRDPQPGDVGVIDSGTGLVMAIKTSGGWAAKAVNGIVGGEYRFLVAWRVVDPAS